MPRRKPRSPARKRIGRVSVYHHHSKWWVYFREGRKPVRRLVGPDRSEAETLAAQINAKLTAGERSPFAFEPMSIESVRQEFLNYHSSVVNSSPATIHRYRTATLHLTSFAALQDDDLPAHEVKAEDFVGYLRQIEVAPNGHENSQRRRLRHKGIIFILETCRSLYGFAAKRRHLPPYAENPFAIIPFGKLKIEDAKPIFVFDENSEGAFLRAADDWAFPIHFTLAKTGLRVGELCHLLIEELDLGGGWLQVHNKPELGWQIKTRRERSVPLIPELVAVLETVIEGRVAGPIFLRRRFGRATPPSLVGDRGALANVLKARRPSCVVNETKLARAVWRDAGALDSDHVRRSFLTIAKAVGLPQATCPKSWRHTFATLLQDANVDPLIRQLTLGHSPTGTAGLGMTANYSHSRKETIRAQIVSATRLWPASLELSLSWMKGVVQ